LLIKNLKHYIPVRRQQQYISIFC